MISGSNKPERALANAELRGGRAARNLLALLVVGACVAVAIYLQRPPATTPADASATDFSSARALGHLRQVAQSPHPIGSAQHVEVRNYLFKELAAAGVNPEVQTTTVAGASASSPFRAAMVSNILAKMRGTESSGAVLLVAHYDTVPDAPGASDDGSGVTTILETARALKAGAPLKNDVIFLLTDGEEVGLMGARAFVGEHPWAKDIRVVLNFEARGNGGPSMMFETSDDNAWLVEEFNEGSPYPIGNSLSYEVYRRLGNDTDLSIFRRAGFPGLNFAYISGIDSYHTAMDTLDHVDERSLQHHGSYALALARRFGNLSLSQHAAGNAIYFNPVGSFLVSYTASLALPLMLVTVLAVIVVVVLGFRKKLLSVGGIVLGVVALVVSGIVTYALVSLMWRLIRRLHSGYEYVPWGEPYNSTLYAVSFVLLAVAVTLALYRWFGKRTSIDNLAIGAVLCWAFLGLAVAILIPGGSFLFTWPLLFALIGLAINFILREWRPVAGWVVFLLCAIPGLFLISPLIKQLFVALTLNGAAAVALLVVLTLGLLLPVIQRGFSFDGWAVPVAALVLSLCFAVFGLSTAKFNRQQPKQNSIFYALNADTGRAVWASMEDMPDEWTSQFLTAHPTEGLLTEMFPLTDEPFLYADAPAAPLAAPSVELLSSEQGDGFRTLRLRVKSPRKAPLLYLFADKDSQIIEGTVEGKNLSAAMGNTGQQRRPWGMNFYGLPEEGVELMIKVATGRPVKIEAVDRSFGLDGVQSASSKPRPDYMMPVSAPYSDAAFVAKTYTF